MASNPTYVFMDIGTTKKKSSDDIDVKITELSMVAVRRDRLLGEVHPLIPGTPAVPRVQLKLTLCFNPGRALGYTAKPGGGFTSDDVRTDDLKTFDENCFQVIDSFLNILTEPIYFIAHKGFQFDFPILKRHINDLGKSFSRNILCADTYFAFYDILEGQKYKLVDESTVEALGQEVAKVSLEEDSASGSVDAAAGRKQANVEKNKLVDESTVRADAIDQEVAEASSEKDSASGSKGEDFAAVARRRQANAERINHQKGFPWGPKENMPGVSYQLSDVHMRVLGVKAEDAHKAEIDCQLMLRIAAQLSDKFVNWVDENHSSFAEHITL